MILRYLGGRKFHCGNVKFVVAGWRLESLRRLDYGSYETVLRVFSSNFANFARIIVYSIPLIIFPGVCFDFYFSCTIIDSGAILYGRD